MLLSSGCIFNNNDQNNKETIDYYYYFQITTEEEEKISIQIPLPINGDETKCIFVNDLIIENNDTTYNIVKTPHGLAYEINFTNNITGYIKGNSKNQINIINDKPIIYLSMDKYSEETGKIDNPNFESKYWVYLNHTSEKNKIEIKIRFEFNYKIIENNVTTNSNRIWELFDIINTNGWNLINGTKKGSIS